MQQRDFTEQIAQADLALDHLTVIYPGDRLYPLADRASVPPLTVIATGALVLEAPEPRLE